uniref:WAP four-disulfide core domain 2 n=1 Tax=Oryzias latipes TaxID=8090 RepID=H2LJ88_ORYLA
MKMATHWPLIGALFFSLCVFVHSSALFYPKPAIDAKPGRCPKHLYGFPSRFHCNCDDDCVDDHKCCEYSCGMVCVPPAIVRLECPNTHGSVGACVEECTCDNDCGSGKKCCSNGCGHVCTTPITVKPGFCMPSINCLGAPSCAEDGNCEGDKKCCHSLGCGMVCKVPYYPENSK